MPSASARPRRWPNGRATARKPLAIERGQTIPPGSTIGILGDGQLGRMSALAAANLDDRVYALRDPDGHIAFAALEEATRSMTVNSAADCMPVASLTTLASGATTAAPVGGGTSAAAK